MDGWMKAAVGQAAAQTSHDNPVTAPPPVKGRVLVLDGDYLAYYAAGNDDTEPGLARRNALDKIEAFRALSGAERVVIHLTASGASKGDRFIAATVKPYQGQRDKGRKPKNWHALRAWLETYQGPVFKTKVWYDREADDGMAYHAAVLGWMLAVIASADKDMRMYPGIHVDWQTYAITHSQPGCFRTENEITGKLFGHAWFWQQMLQGDTADHIPGLPKYRKPNGTLGLLGEKTAAKLLADATNDAEALDVVAELYRGYWGEDKEYDWADALAEQATLLWMREDKHAKSDDWLRTVDPNHMHHSSLRRAADTLNERIDEAYRLVQEIDG